MSATFPPGYVAIPDRRQTARRSADRVDRTQTRLVLIVSALSSVTAVAAVVTIIVRWYS